MLQPRPLVWSLGTAPAATCRVPWARVAASAAAARRTLYTGNYVPSNQKKSQMSPEAQGLARVLRSYKPRTPGLRHLKRPINDHLWTGRPFKPLTLPKKGMAKAGRNSSGKITVKHRGGGHKRRIRIVDYERWAPGPHIVERIEGDPNRSAHLALVTEQATGKKSYIVAADGMRAGDVVASYRAGLPKELLDSMGGIIDPGILASKTAWRGNCLPLHMVPVGTSIFNIGSTARNGGVYCRSAGTFGVVVAKDDAGKKNKKSDKDESESGVESIADPTDIEARIKMEEEREQQERERERASRFVNVRLVSGEVRRFHRDACCTIGVASNVHYNKRQLGKAGRSRWLGIRPTVRGVAMNKVDHPHGGGRGKSKSNRIPTSETGVIAKSGYKTRPKHKQNKYLVTPRPRIYGRKKKKELAAGARQ